MSGYSKILIILISLIGLFTSVELVNIYVNANFNAYALSSFCSINSFVDCDGIAKTTHSQFLGIPLALWGVLFYIIVLFFMFVDKLKNIKFLKFLEVFKNPQSYIFCLGIFAFAVSIVLGVISIFAIKKICVLCFFTYFLDLLIALAAKSWGKGILYDVKLSVVDFIDALKIKKYLIAFIALMLVAGSFLTYTSISYVLAPQVKKVKEFRYYQKMKDNPFKVSGNLLGERGAKVIVHEYTDYNCPFCRIVNIMLHQAAKELSGVWIIPHNLPFDTTCNKYLGAQMHEGSCMLARYSIAAGKQDKYWDFNSLLFDRHPKTEKDILKLAVKVDLDVDQLEKDANSPEVKKELLDEIDKAIAQRIDATPTLMINMKQYTGVKSYAELKKILIDLGAKRRLH